MIHRDATLGQQFLDVALGQAVAQVPAHRDRDHLTRKPAHVHDVHDLHVWTVTSNLPTLSAHVVIDDACFTDGHAPRLLDDLRACLTGHGRRR